MLCIVLGPLFTVFFVSLWPSVLVLAPAIKAFLFLFWLTLFGVFRHPVRVNLCIFVHACWSALHVGVNCRLGCFVFFFF